MTRLDYEPRQPRRGRQVWPLIVVVVFYGSLLAVIAHLAWVTLNADARF